MNANPERKGFYLRFGPKAFIVVTLTNTPSIAEVLSGIKSKNSSWAVSDAISRSRKHGVTIFSLVQTKLIREIVHKTAHS